MINKKDTVLVVSEKSWNKSLVDNLKLDLTNFNWLLINKREDFTSENLKKINPSKIFIPHWSYIIPEVIFNNFECIVFHMTDLPYGRGGSPLQNLIVEGHETTKISALKVEKGLDTGDIYLKKELSLDGTAQEIFERASIIIENMIKEIIENNLIPKAQEGEPVNFKRRTPEMSNIKELDSIDKIYDYIRMLDADAYPHAFMENDFFKFEFTKAKKSNDKIIEANVRIIKK